VENIISTEQITWQKDEETSRRISYFLSFVKYFRTTHPRDKKYTE